MGLKATARYFGSVRKTPWYDLGYELLHEGNSIPEYLDNYIDYARYSEELSYDGFHECDYGIIEIRR